jgi:NAD(P)-dependent dehydrogenase (short-subunit alcohol dehydrogenase family)
VTANLQLDGRVGLVAGAGRGIGRAIAIGLAGAGARVAVAARTVEELEETAAACGGAMVCRCDVAQEREVAALIEQVERELGRLDVLVNAAGVYGPIGPTVDVDLDKWRRAVDVNLYGTLYLCRAALPGMQRRRSGKIILLGGGGATAPLALFSAYAASKAALVRFAETLAEEVSADNVQINVIAPGLVDTRLQDDVLAARARAGPLFEKIERARTTGEGAVPPELAAELAVFLASDASGTLTGKLISAPNDPWREWRGRDQELNRSQLLTLRRLDPFTIRSVAGDEL